MKPLGKVKIKWSPEFAYALGLITTDGNLSIDGRHINFTSKDLELIKKFKIILGLKNRIGRKSRAKEENKKYFQIQFGDVNFYRFLLRIGLSPKKSKIIGALDIPDKYFFDFLRGHFDGDGTFYSYWDPRWRSSFMFYTVFISASKDHIEWLRDRIFRFLKIKGHITKDGKKIVHHLKYAKKESLKLLTKIYYSSDVICLSRKRLKIEKALSIIGLRL
ncbi:MAG: LAGLIDADG family homing endonuclease [Patescibacteria group bacterium]